MGLEELTLDNGFVGINEAAQFWNVFNDEADPNYFIVFSEYKSRESEAEHVELWS